MVHLQPVPWGYISITTTVIGLLCLAIFTGLYVIVGLLGGLVTNQWDRLATPFMTILFIAAVGDIVVIIRLYRRYERYKKTHPDEPDNFNRWSMWIGAQAAILLIMYRERRKNGTGQPDTGSTGLT